MKGTVFQKWTNLVIAGLVVLSPAAGVTVTNTNDTGAGSLRDVILNAAPGDTIDFSLPSLPATIFLQSGDLFINKNLTITGPGASVLSIDATNSVNSARVFTVQSGIVSISGLTITHGGGGPDDNGGGVFNAGTLTLSNCIISNNSVKSAGTGGGGIFNAAGGDLKLELCTVFGNSTGNQAAITGGGIRNSNSAKLTLINSTVSSNSAPIGGGIWNDGDLTIDRSTISGNSAGVGISTPATLEGGGIYNSASSTGTIVNSTIANNHAKDNGGGIANDGTLHIAFSTFAGNSAQNGAGAIRAANNPLTLKSSILANSGPNGNCAFSSGALVSTGDNLSDDNSCTTVFTQTGDINNTSAGLRPAGLQNNGGPTSTIGLIGSSAAINHIPVASCTDSGGIPLGLDQRGIGRPQGAQCDIGAYESNPPTITGFNPASGAIGPSVTITGTNFLPVNMVTFNGTNTSFAVNSGTLITAMVPPGATSGPIAVTSPEGTAISATTFTVTGTAAPTITGFSPTSGKAGTSVTITGTNLNGATAVAFNGVQATFKMQGQKIVATVPLGATTGKIQVTTPSGTVISAATFTVIATPAITDFTPTSGEVGTQVTINGSSLTGVTAVTFGNKSATFTIVSDLKITATVPDHARSGPISVTAPGGTATSAASFTVTK